jgi:hypothetical protein
LLVNPLDVPGDVAIKAIPEAFSPDVEAFKGEKISGSSQA